MTERDRTRKGTDLAEPTSSETASSAPTSPITEDDLHWFNEGTHSHLYEKLGAHPDQGGTHFAVWAPNAAEVSLTGDFNGWNRGSHKLYPRGQSGIWEGFLRGVGAGAV